MKYYLVPFIPSKLKKINFHFTNVKTLLSSSNINNDHHTSYKIWQYVCGHRNILQWKSILKKLLLFNLTCTQSGLIFEWKYHGVISEKSISYHFENKKRENKTRAMRIPSVVCVCWMLNRFILLNSLACSSMSHRFSPTKCSKWFRSQEVVKLNWNYLEDKNYKTIVCAIISQDRFIFFYFYTFSFHICSVARSFWSILFRRKYMSLTNIIHCGTVRNSFNFRNSDTNT